MTKNPTTREELSALSNADLVALYNRLTGKSTKKFATRAKGEEQTWSALRTPVAARRGDAVCEGRGHLVEGAPARKAKTAPAKPAPAADTTEAEETRRTRSEQLDFVESALRGGATLETLMADTGPPAAKIRAMIDRVRRRGVKVTRTGPKSWHAQD